MPILPALLCIDVEPDARVPDQARPQPPAGFERLLPLVPRLRDRLASVTGVDARFTWCLRLDPQIAEVYGAADWLATSYGHQLEQLRAEGDVFGLHPHSWRWRDGWVSDQADEAWVAHCAQVGLESYRNAFGRGCEVYRHGDRFMSSPLARQIEEAGVRVDLSVEPGLPSAPGLEPGEATTGCLPDTRAVPHFAYRPSPGEFRIPDPSRNDGLLIVPLTPGLVVSTHPTDGRLVPTGSYETLVLWTEPDQFERMLRLRLRQPQLSHLAFAIRSDVALLPDAWATVERNLADIGRQLQLHDGHRWCTALEAAELIEPPPAAPTPTADERAGPVDDRAAHWLRGEADPGYREGAEPEAFDALTRAAGGLVHRLSTLGIGNGAGTGAPPHLAADHEPGDAHAISGPARAGDAIATLRWVDEERELSCPVCRVSGTAHRFASARAAWRGGAETGVLRCRYCRAIVLEGTPDPPLDLDDSAIDAYIEHGAGIEAILATLSPLEPRPGLRFLDVGCGYGFGLDLTRFVWGWEGVGLDPWNLGARGRRELGIDIRPDALAPGLDLGDEPFDVVLASETLEHVEEPLAFLRELRRRLAPDGVLALSTPDAGFVRPESPARDVLAILGLGQHVFLVDRDGLDRLLRRAGFRAVEVHDDRGSLRAAASPSEDGLARCRPVAGPDLDLLARYCDARAGAAPPGSALRVGMAARHVRYALHRGDPATAEQGYGRLREALVVRHGIDLDDPGATCRRAISSSVPMVAGEAHFGAGLLELLARERPDCAAAQFAAAAMAANTALRGASAAPVWLELRAIGHEALALARSAPDRAPAALGRLRHAAGQLVGSEVPEVDVLCGRVFTELVAGGHYDAADEARALVVLPTGSGSDDDDATADGRAGLDTVFSLAMLALQRDRAADAAAYFGLCARLAARVHDPDARQLGDTARAHETMALDRLTGHGQPHGRSRDVAPGPASDRGHANTRLRVTAVVPVYNGGRHLREAVASIVAQTEPPDELVVVDDGSSDGGIGVLDGVSAPFPIRVVHQEHAGQSAARNRAIEHAQGELLAFLDQDDAWHPEHLAVLCRPFLEDPAVGWVYSDFDEIDAEGRTVTLSFLREHAIPHPRQTLAACLAQDLMVIPSASVIRRTAFEALGGFDEMLQGYEDDDLYVRAFRSRWRLVFQDRALARFRVHGASSSADARFAESRLSFSKKLQEAVADDRRLNRYYFRDVVAPRFFRSSLDDYIRAVSDRDWELAYRTLADLEHFARLHRDHAVLGRKLLLLRNPRRFRWMLRINESLPLSLRVMKDPRWRLR